MRAVACGRRVMDRRPSPALRDDGDLRRLYFEWLELAGAPLWILRRHVVPHDPHRRIVGNHPFGHPELALGLAVCLPVAHRQIDDPAGVGEVHDELSRTIALSRGVDGVHPEPDRFTSLE